MPVVVYSDEMNNKYSCRKALFRSDPAGLGITSRKSLPFVLRNTGSVGEAPLLAGACCADADGAAIGRSTTFAVGPVVAGAAIAVCSGTQPHTKDNTNAARIKLCFVREEVDLS
jgi:hypothetical protein